jgi:branched-chain amino acid transport system ATP-binding protein
MTTLSIENVTLTFGGLNALSDVNMTIEPGLITSIIGPNGAGKTSMLNCISGFYHPTTGEIRYGDKRLTHALPHQVTKLGIARAFQNLELFSGLSVLDNLMLARHTNLKYNFLQAMIYVGKASRLEAENRAYVEDVIDFMELEPYRKSTVGNLAYGIQKRVEVARALTLNPQLLLLDEPMAGMNMKKKKISYDSSWILKKSRRQQSFWLNMIWVLSWIFPIASMCWTSGKSSDRGRRKKWLLTKRLSRLTSEKINWTRKTRNSFSHLPFHNCCAGA